MLGYGLLLVIPNKIIKKNIPSDYFQWEKYVGIFFICSAAIIFMAYGICLKNSGNIVRDEIPIAENILIKKNIDGKADATEINLQEMLLTETMSQREVFYRGWYLHHYGTILMPYREMLGGNLSMGLSSQYGVIALLPLLLSEFKALEFQYYSAFGMFICALLCVYTIFSKLIGNKYLAGLLLIFAVIFQNLEQLKISPGFSIYRFLPSILLIIYISKIEGKLKIYDYLFILALAVLNSVGLNILILLILLGISVKDFTKKSDTILNPKLFSLIIVVIIFQIYQGYIARDLIPYNIFGSIGVTEINYLYVLMILSPVLISVLINIIKKDMIGKGYAIGVISYVIFSSYVLSFPNSHQHLGSFLLLSTYSLYLVISNTNIRSNTLKIFILAPLFVYLIDSGYLKNNLYLDYPVTGVRSAKSYGDILKFNSTMSLEVISGLYDEIIENKVNKGAIAFLSKDKPYIELYKNLNYKPLNFDPFVNILSQNPSQVISFLNTSSYSYIVLNNSADIVKNLSMNDTAKKFGISSSELDEHNKILKNQLTIQEYYKKNLIGSNERYSIYKTK